MKIFEAVRQEHEKQRLLLKILAETSGDTPARREFYSELKEQIEAQNCAEERYHCSPLEHSGNDAPMSSKEKHGRAEIEQLLEKLDRTEMSSPEWLHNLKALQQKVESYLNEEEREFFQVADKAFNEQNGFDTSEFEGEMEKALQRA